MRRIHPLVAVLLHVICGLSITSIAQAASSFTLTAAAQSNKLSSSVTLNWNALATKATYTVYRDFSTQLVTTTATSFIDTKVAGGQTHMYYVVGLSGVSHSLVLSNPVTVKIAIALVPPTTPQGLSASAVWRSVTPVSIKTGPEANLSWQASPGATGYNLYRGGALLVSGLQSTSYGDTAITSGQSYGYAVTAVGPGGESAKSGIVTVTAPEPPAPTAPLGLTATPQWVTSCPVCNGMAMAHIVLGWTAVSGVTSYNVYRSGTLLQSGITSPSYTDMSVSSGQTYSYTVCAVDPGGVSAKSAQASATAPNPPASASSVLTAPVNVGVIGLWNGGAGDLISWDSVPDAVGYNVYQYDVLIAKGVTGTSYLVTPNLFNGGMTYTITAVDSMGMESLPSAIAGAQGTPNPAQQPSWTPDAPTAPICLTATPEWNAGVPRIHLIWQETADASYQGPDSTYNVYRDGRKVAAGLFGLNYFDTKTQPGETHTYTVTGVNVPWTTPVESAPSAAVTATALTAAPSAEPSKVQITNVRAGDDSALVSFAAVPGAMDYRVYDTSNPNSVKYSGGGLSVQMNGLNPAGANLVVEALDKLGPFQKMDGGMGPGAMDMSGATHSGVNGQGDPSDLPNVIATSDPIAVTLQPQGLTGSQAFYDNFRNEQPLVPAPVAPAIIAAPVNLGAEITGFENDKWQIVNYDTDTAMSKLFFMGNHFMDTIYDGPTAAITPFSHNNNASMVMSPKAIGDISGGKVLHVTFEVDGHFDGRRWCDLFIGKAGDPIIHPGKFAQTDGGDNYATVSGDLFRWEVRSGAHDVEVFHGGTDTDLMQFSDWNDSQTVARSTWDGKPITEGTTQDLDKRNRFDLYLSQTRFRIVETTADGTHTIIRDKQFPAGTVLPFTQCQIYFVHQLYHTGNDRPEQLIFSSGASSYWYNYRPWSDERHWDNMGFEVLPSFPQ